MEQMISIPESLYLRLVDYFDDKSDADGDSQGMYPNEEMKLLTELEKCKPSNSFELRGSFNDNAPIVFSSEKDMDDFLKKKDGEPIVEERFYDATGKLCGMSILVESGKLPLTGKQYAQWRIEELKRR